MFRQWNKNWILELRTLNFHFHFSSFVSKNRLLFWEVGSIHETPANTTWIRMFSNFGKKSAFYLIQPCSAASIRTCETKTKMKTNQWKIDTRLYRQKHMLVIAQTFHRLEMWKLEGAEKKSLNLFTMRNDMISFIRNVALASVCCTV